MEFKSLYTVFPPNVDQMEYRHSLTAQSSPSRPSIVSIVNRASTTGTLEHHDSESPHHFAPVPVTFILVRGVKYRDSVPSRSFQQDPTSRRLSEMLELEFSRTRQSRGTLIARRRLLTQR